MRKTVQTVFATLASAALLVAAPLPAGAITFGQPDNGRHPEVGSLVAEFSGQKYQICTGTLVAAEVFLAASHCLVGLEAVNMWVTFDEVIDQNEDGIVDATVNLIGAPVDTRHPHPAFDTGGENDTFDVAVITLPAQRIAPAQLPPAGLLDQIALKDQTFTTVGYGAVRNTKRYGPAGLQVGTARLIATQTVNSITKAWITLSMNPSTGNGGTCYGDSGGPHFLGSGNSETKVVVSLTVTGDAPCRSTDKTYRFDTRSARDFLSTFVTLP